MIPNRDERALTTSPISDDQTINFEISTENSVNLMMIVRDQIYTDKELAVLREYISNGLDAHVSVGKADLPLQVHLPTVEDCVLRIRDFGPGLSRTEMREVYSQYGKSTRANSNKSIGMMGIGSKSAFCYTDSFTVTSWNGGAKEVYSVVLDESDMGKIIPLHAEPCLPEETGIEIQVPVNGADIVTFHERYKWLVRYFDVRPEANIEVPQLQGVRLNHGYLDAPDVDKFVSSQEFKFSTEWNVVMGQIPYKVNLSQVGGDRLPTYWPRIGGALFLKIGEGAVAASREEIKYTNTTKQKLVAAFTNLIDDYVQDQKDKLNKKEFTSDWDRAIFSVSWKKTPIPAVNKLLSHHKDGSESISFRRDGATTYSYYKKEYSTRLGGYKNRLIEVPAVVPTHESYFVLWDGRFSVNAIEIKDPKNAIIVKDGVPRVKNKFADWDKELSRLIIEGAPCVRASTLYIPPTKRVRSVGTPKPKPPKSDVKVLTRDIRRRVGVNRWMPTLDIPGPEDLVLTSEPTDAYYHADTLKDFSKWGGAERRCFVVPPNHPLAARAETLKLWAIRIYNEIFRYNKEFREHFTVDKIYNDYSLGLHRGSWCRRLDNNTPTGVAEVDWLLDRCRFYKKVYYSEEYRRHALMFERMKSFIPIPEEFKKVSAVLKNFPHLKELLTMSIEYDVIIAYAQWQHAQNHSNDVGVTYAGSLHHDEEQCNRGSERQDLNDSLYG